MITSASVRRIPSRLDTCVDAFLNSLPEGAPATYRLELGAAGISLNGRCVAPRGHFTPAAKRLWNELRPLDSTPPAPLPGSWAQAAARHLAYVKTKTPVEQAVGYAKSGTNAVQDAGKLVRHLKKTKLLVGAGVLSDAVKVHNAVGELARANEIGDGAGLFRARTRIAVGTYGLVAFSLGWAIERLSRVATVAFGAVGVGFSALTTLWEGWRAGRAAQFRADFYSRLQAPYRSQPEQLEEALRFLRDQLILTPLERVEVGEDPVAQSKFLQEKWARFERHAGVVGDIQTFVARIDTLLSSRNVADMRAFCHAFSKQNYAHVVRRVAIVASIALGLAAAAISIAMSGGLSVPIMLGVATLLSVITNWDSLVAGFASLCWKIRGNHL